MIEPENGTFTHGLRASEPQRLSRRAVLASALCAAALAGCEKTARGPGEVIVGSSPTGVPFSFVDPWTNELTGAIVEVASAACAAAGFAPDLRITPFAALIPSLLAFKIDVIAAAMLRNAAREEIVDFSDPVFAYSGGLAVRRDDPRRFPDLSSLRDVRVGAQVGSRFLSQLADAGVSQVPTYENLGDLLRDLKHGRIDAVYGDEPIMSYQLRVGPPMPIRMADGFQAPPPEDVCLVLRKNSPLMPAINSALAALRATQIPQISKKWDL